MQSEYLLPGPTGKLLCGPGRPSACLPSLSALMRGPGLPLAGLSASQSFRGPISLHLIAPRRQSGDLRRDHTLCGAPDKGASRPGDRLASQKGIRDPALPESSSATTLGRPSEVTLGQRSAAGGLRACGQVPLWVFTVVKS